MEHNVEEITLTNGARGLLIDIPGATVMSFRYHFRAGHFYGDSDDTYETAHIMEHMAFGANARFADGNAYEQEFTKNGAYHNAYTSDISMSYEAICADFEWDRIFDLQRMAICTPRFLPRELAAEKGNVKSELTGYLNNHSRLLWPRIQRALGDPVLTYNQRLKTIANVTLKDVKEHYRKTHTTSNMRFVIAGKLSGRKQQLIRELEAWPLPKGERLPRKIVHFKKARPVFIQRKDASNITFALSMTIPRELSLEEGDSLAFLNHILTNTMSSRIFGAARKKGLAHGMRSGAESGMGSATWDFGGQVNSETSSQLFDIIVREMSNVLKGKITDDEWEAAKTYYLGRYQMGAQTVSAINNIYADMYFYRDMVLPYKEAPQMIRRARKEEAERMTREFIQQDTWVLAAVMNGGRDHLKALNDKIERLFI